jgi:hypothetical protein
MVGVVAAVMMGGHNSLSSALLWRYALDRLFFCELVNNWRSDAFERAENRMLECSNVLLLRSCLGAARRALRCSYRSPSRAGASARRGVTAPTRMHGSAKLMRELKNLLPRADHTEVYA